MIIIPPDHYDDWNIWGKITFWAVAIPAVWVGMSELIWLVHRIFHH